MSKGFAVPFFLCLILSRVGPALAANEANRLVSIVDYIGADYPNSVRDGKIVNPDEYGEMEEFAAAAQAVLAKLKAASQGDKAGVEPDIRALADHIRNKRDARTIQETARSVKQKLISAYGIATAPTAIPSLAAGKAVYGEYCAQCHGESGRGDGPSRATLKPPEPAPANFADPEVVGALSPFQAFNTATFGVPGTAMADFSALPEIDRWQAAFYIFSLRFSAEAAAEGKTLFRSNPSAQELTGLTVRSTLTDKQLEEKLAAYFPGDRRTDNALAYLRRGLLEEKAADPLLVAGALVRDAAELYRIGDREQAYRKAIEAYIDGFELAEPALFAKDASFGRDLESRFASFRNAVRQGAPDEEIERLATEIETGLERAARLTGGDGDFPAYYSFLNSALIILREGLEAALILAAVVAMLRVMGAGAVVRYVHLGWILALLAGGLTWLAAQTVITMSGWHRESMEGFISVFAAVALFYVGYWLHTRTEAGRWRAFIHDKVQNVLSAKRIFGLVGIAFFAVYREAFEVVLFYQALWFQYENHHGAVLAGFGAGTVALLLATFGIFKLGLRIPLKYFFGATGALLYLMAFIFAGNGIKELQAAGWVPATPLGLSFQAPMLGIYPTLETLAAQAAMLAAFLATAAWLRRDHRRADSGSAR